MNKTILFTATAILSSALLLAETKVLKQSSAPAAQASLTQPHELLGVEQATLTPQTLLVINNFTDGTKIEFRATDKKTGKLEVLDKIYAYEFGASNRNEKSFNIDYENYTYSVAYKPTTAGVTRPVAYKIKECTDIFRVPEDVIDLRTQKDESSKNMTCLSQLATKTQQQNAARAIQQGALLP